MPGSLIHFNAFCIATVLSGRLSQIHAASGAAFASVEPSRSLAPPIATQSVPSYNSKEEVSELKTVSPVCTDGLVDEVTIGNLNPVVAFIVAALISDIVID